MMGEGKKGSIPKLNERTQRLSERLPMHEEAGV